MSNISRRKFLKGAGVAALAVAAAGVLAGCSNEDLTKVVEISYIFADENIPVGNVQKLTVDFKDATVPVEKLEIPEGYKLVDENATVFPIDKDNKVEVKVTGTKKPVTNVGINFIYNGSNLNAEEIIIRLESDQTVVPVATLNDLLGAYYPDYELEEQKDATLLVFGSAKIANVKVVKKA